MDILDEMLSVPSYDAVNRLVIFKKKSFLKNVLLDYNMQFFNFENFCEVFKNFLYY